VGIPCAAAARNLAVPTLVTAYRPAQGTYARGFAAAAGLALALFASYRLYGWGAAREWPTVAVWGMDVSYAALAGAAVFVAAGAVIFVLTYGPTTGLKGLDARTHALIDLLIDTEAEMRKVSWPDREELVRSTTAVLVCIVLLGAFLFCVDWVLVLVMRALRVLR